MLCQAFIGLCQKHPVWVAYGFFVALLFLPVIPVIVIAVLLIDGTIWLMAWLTASAAKTAYEAAKAAPSLIPQPKPQLPPPPPPAPPELTKWEQAALRRDSILTAYQLAVQAIQETEHDPDSKQAAINAQLEQLTRQLGEL